MRQLLGNTTVTVQSFSFNRICNGAEWEYMCYYNPTSDAWSATRRKIENPRIPPFMQILAGKVGCPRLFVPVINNEDPVTIFADPEDLVGYIEENY